MNGFGAALLRARRARDWSTADLGQQAGYDASAISRWEQGQRQPTRQSVEQLCAALRLGPRERAAWLVSAGYVPEQGTLVIENGCLVALLGLPAEEGANGATP